MADSDPKLANLVGRKIRAFRVDFGMTRAELAHRMLTTERAIHRVEVGDFGITLARLYRFAQALGVHPADLLPEPGELSQETAMAMDDLHAPG